MSSINNPILDLNSTPPIEMSEAVRCFCGSMPSLVGGTMFRKRFSIECGNRRCGRTVEVDGIEFKEGVEKWNRDVRIASCVRHSYVSNETDDGWHCPHCDCRFDKDLQEVEL